LNDVRENNETANNGHLSANGKQPLSKPPLFRKCSGEHHEQIKRHTRIATRESLHNIIQPRNPANDIDECGHASGDPHCIKRDGAFAQRWRKSHHERNDNHERNNDIGHNVWNIRQHKLPFFMGTAIQYSRPQRNCYHLWNI